MKKLYRKTGDSLEYWETWEDRGKHTIHWGLVGHKGERETFGPTLFGSSAKKVAKLIADREAQGFREIPMDQHSVLQIEYSVVGMGSSSDLDKRHRLENRMDEVLGWAGLGCCDGGSIGSGTMEVCCLVVDFDVAHRVIAENLAGTEFGDYSRVYQEKEGESAEQ